MRKRTPEQSTGKGAAIIYCRVSSAKQEEEGTSLDSQESACIQRATELGFTIGRITREVYTGAELWDRPKLALDRADLKAGKFQAIIAYAIDRLSRDPIHLAIIADECERSGTALEFVTEKLDDSSEGQLIAYIRGYAAKLEREKIRERVIRGQKQRVLEGRVPGMGFDLYGYRKDREAGTRVVYEPEAAVVRDIYTWIGIEGASLKTVIRRLSDQRVPSPATGKVSYSESGRQPRWGTGTLARMLRQPAYKGEAYAWQHMSRYQNGRSLGTGPRPQEDWIRLPDGVVPAIVSQELWDAVQRQLDTNMGQHTRNMNKARRYLLRGLVTCGVCGRPMYAGPTGLTGFGYRCSSRKNNGRACGGSTVVSHLLEDWVWEQVMHVLRNPQLIADEVNKLQEQGPDPMMTSDLENARRKIAKLEKQQAGLGTRLREAAADAVLWDLLMAEIGKIERERTEILVAISQLEARLAERQQLVSQLEAIPVYCERVRQNLDTFDFDEKRLAIEALGIRVTANSRRQWRIDGRIPMNDGVVFQQT